MRLLSSSPCTSEFIGAAQTVTGSMHLLRRVTRPSFLDCGLYQGRRAEVVRAQPPPPLPIGEIDAVVLSTPTSITPAPCRSS